MTAGPQDERAQRASRGPPVWRSVRRKSAMPSARSTHSQNPRGWPGGTHRTWHDNFVRLAGRCRAETSARPEPVTEAETVMESTDNRKSLIHQKFRAGAFGASDLHRAEALIGLAPRPRRSRGRTCALLRVAAVADRHVVRPARPPTSSAQTDQPVETRSPGTRPRHASHEEPRPRGDRPPRTRGTPPKRSRGLPGSQHEPSAPGSCS